MIVMIWLVSAATQAKADGSSLAAKIEEKKAGGETALNPKPEFIAESILRLQLDALANNDKSIKTRLAI